MKTAVEDRGKDGLLTSKSQSKRGGRQQLKDSRKKSPTGKSRGGRHTSALTTSPMPDVITSASDAEARYETVSHVPLSCTSLMCLCTAPQMCLCAAAHCIALCLCTAPLRCASVVLQNFL